MGRGRGGTKAATNKESGSTKPTDKAPRTTRGARKSYVEDEGSEEDFRDDAPSSPEDVGGDSGSDFEAESSGSEYGKKKKKGKPSPKKAPAKRGRKPAGKAQLSPKKRGRKPKAATAASSNGKRKRPAESSDEEEKASSEEVSEDEASGSGDTSGSEYGKKKSNKKLKKEKPPTRSQPKRQAAPAPKKRGRKPKETTNGNKKAKLEAAEKDNSEDDMETDEPEKKRSDEEGEGTTEDEVKETKPAAAAPVLDKDKKSSGKDDVEEEDDKTEEAESPKSEEAEEKSGSDDEEEEKDEAKTKKKEKPGSSSGSNGESNLMNPTKTDYDSLDFTCDKKTPADDSWNFKISCWNVAGIRAWVKKDGLEYLKRENPDVICLQEIKCSDKTKPSEVKSIPDYPHTYWCYAEEANGHNGVATFSKVKPESVCYGIPVGDDDSEEDKKIKRNFNKEGRLIVTEFEKFYLLNVYVPNGGRGVKDDKHPRGYPPRVTNGERQTWDRVFKDYIKTLDDKKPVIVTGDFNVAHESIDLANPKTNTNTAGFTQEERDGFTELLNSLKLVDSFRSLYPDEKAYTFWTYIGNARSKNVGWRLDYFLLSEKLKESLVESTIRKDVFGSDHCPIVLFVHL